MIRTSQQLIDALSDYMFTTNNVNSLIKHMIPTNQVITLSPLSKSYQDKELQAKIKETDFVVFPKSKPVPVVNSFATVKEKVKREQTIYKPRQKDTLFWCFYILKHGYSNYEMEINNQYFTVEKREKFNYINIIRNNKDILKLHKIKPICGLEDDLANKDKISIKTFFALCILENINVLLVDKRKIFEIMCVDPDEKHKINVIHKDDKTNEYYIELNIDDKKIQNYRDTYMKLSSFDTSLKAMGSYKLDELHDLCKKLDINIGEGKKTKKEIYELLVLHY